MATLLRPGGRPFITVTSVVVKPDDLITYDDDRIPMLIAVTHPVAVR